MKKISKKIVIISASLAILIISWWFYSANLANSLENNYQSLSSSLWRDRLSRIITIKPNYQGNYTVFQTYPENIKKLVIKKEDKFFYFHPGINLISLARASWYNLTNRPAGGASTISQQLAKILLNQENNRNFNNKTKELAYALALETHWSKEKILNSYLNTIYLGNQTQGLNQASQLYFNKKAELLTDSELISLIATINNPTSANPFNIANTIASKNLAEQFKINLNQEEITFTSIKQKTALANFRAKTQDQSLFELNDFGFSGNLNLTIDKDLTSKLREVLKTELDRLASKKVTNGAIVVLKQPENELLAIIGSPKPTAQNKGYQINLALKPRPIGSTIKPLIYLYGFQKGLRPYSLVDDQEYKYIINDGFAFYPKNFNYQYQGRVNLHYALANSLNVPSLKILDYLGLDNLNNFFTKTLELRTLQNIKTYQLSLALGGIEVEPLSMAYYFSLFSNQGKLKPLITNFNNQPNKFKLLANINQNKTVSEPGEIQLINKILNDRKTGMDQFSQVSNLNLPHTNYCVKTGTSREFHDSWTIGYTPDFTVAVWIGNSADTAMNELSGSLGAGAIWQRTMNLLYSSNYNKNKPLNFSLLKEYQQENNLEYGIAGDNFSQAENLLISKNLILNPHDGDIFLLEPKTTLVFKAKEKAVWLVDDKIIGTGEKINWQPKKAGKYIITANFNKTSETTSITLNKE